MLRVLLLFMLLITVVLGTAPKNSTVETVPTVIKPTPTVKETKQLVSVEKTEQPLVADVVKLSAADSVFLSVKNEERVVDDLEWKSLAVTLYCEARGESNYGIAAVADTIRNRVNSNMFPNTYYGVVTQRKQFSCIHDTKNITSNVVMTNSIDVRDFRKMLKISYRVLTGEMPRMTYNALFYHTVRIRPYWSKKYHKLGVVGHHIFYTTTKL